MKKPGLGNMGQLGSLVGRVNQEQAQVKTKQTTKTAQPAIRDQIEGLPSKGLVGKSSPLEGIVTGLLDRRFALMGYTGQQSPMGLRVDSMLPQVVGMSAPKVDLRMRRALKKWLSALKRIKGLMDQDDDETEQDAEELALIYTLVEMD